MPEQSVAGADAGEAFKAFEAEGWSAQAQSYDGLTGAITARLVEPLLDAAGVREGMRVLDVATGPGYVAERAATRGARPVGVDLAEGMLQLARRRNPKIEFVSADAEQLPFEDETFEAAVGGFVLNHLPRPERAVAEAARVVCAGGGVAFSVWDRPERMRVVGVLRDAIAAAGAEHDAQMPEGGPNPYRLADDAGFGRLLRGAGLAEVNVQTIELTHRVDDTAQLWSGLLGSTVRSAALVRAQPPVLQRRVREHLERVVEPYRQASGWLEIPVVAKIGPARVG